ncbi:MAG: Gfo/Idh/MocA family oxidoreductase [Fimbriiglobus sp.]|nr:Gfo/Idh/MocA family oxidoreductase [Fimbriiglobus sp.]
MFDLASAHRPTLPRRKDWRIGCAGGGFIMADCHLVAYRNAGFNPVAIASRTQDTARKVAERHAIPAVHATFNDLLADPQIEILDVAVPPQNQPDLIRRACKLGRGRLRGILAQKPLAMSVKVARELVNLCADAGIVLAVNQNMRFDQSVRAMNKLLDAGELGTPVFASIDMRAVPHWMPWAEGLPSLSTFVMSIHHLDTFRYWFGTPDRVLASTRPDPRTNFPHTDGINLYILEWEDGRRASGWDDVWTGPGEVVKSVSDSRVSADDAVRIRWRVEGTRGIAVGTIGWPKYPERVPSTLAYRTAERPDTWVESQWKEVWFPDAFVGTMAQLMVAIEDGTEPEISGRDNVETVALCEAVFAAANHHRVCTVNEFAHAD